MDNNKIGKFIATLRREKNLTQQELGDKLFVTDKAVSKWERGLSLPDITLLNKLANILDVEVVDILDGKKETTRKINIEEEIEKIKIELNKRHFWNTNIYISISMWIFYIFYFITKIHHSKYKINYNKQ